MSDEEKKESDKVDQSRRNFIKNSGLTIGGLVLGGVAGGLIGSNSATTKSQTTTKPVKSHETKEFTEAMQFFSRKEDFDTLAAATECIFPEDENGPGAIALRAPYYIDKQLASPWGRNVNDYRKRPFKDGQTPLNRGEIFLQGIRKLDEEGKKKFQKSFRELEEAEQIEILQDFESGKVKLEYVTSAKFFAMLRQSTLEGVYCDPLYGGNKNMDGWKMKEYPGAQMSYANVIESKEFVKIEPMSLSDHF